MAFSDLFTGKAWNSNWWSGDNSMLSGTSERDKYNRQMQNKLGTIQAPNLQNMFSQYKNEVMGSVKPPTDLNQYYDKARQNLSYNMNNQVADTSAQAGALAASRQLANPSGFVANQAQNVRQSFVPQFGQLESEQALRTAQQQDEYSRYLTGLLAQLGQGQMGAAQNDFSNQLGLFNIEAGMANNYDPYSNQDKLFSFLGDASKAATLFI